MVFIAHFYAPIATFKTVVDGQGDVTKRTYRQLEREEVEGTRCPTSYDLFLLFAEKYPITPKVTADKDKEPIICLTKQINLVE